MRVIEGISGSLVGGISISCLSRPFPFFLARRVHIALCLTCNVNATSVWRWPHRSRHWPNVPRSLLFCFSLLSTFPYLSCMNQSRYDDEC